MQKKTYSSLKTDGLRILDHLPEKSWQLVTFLPRGKNLKPRVPKVHSALTPTKHWQLQFLGPTTAEVLFEIYHFTMRAWVSVPSHPQSLIKCAVKAANQTNENSRVEFGNKFPCFLPQFEGAKRLSDGLAPRFISGKKDSGSQNTRKCSKHL